MSLYITGDPHRAKERFTDPACGIAGVLGFGDAVIVCGDFQFLFDQEQEKEETVLDELADLPFEIWFCDGNHENFLKLNAYPKEQWNGGWIHRIRPNIIHLMRGQVYELYGRTFFVMGGGHSFGENPPLIPEKTWWPEETPSKEECAEGWNQLERYGYQVDYIITHTPPGETMRLAAPDYEADRLSAYLDQVQKKVYYRHWYFGHLHQDAKMWKNQTCLWHGVEKLF